MFAEELRTLEILVVGPYTEILTVILHGSITIMIADPKNLCRRCKSLIIIISSSHDLITLSSVKI